MAENTLRRTADAFDSPSHGKPVPPDEAAAGRSPSLEALPHAPAHCRFLRPSIPTSACVRLQRSATCSLIVVPATTLSSKCEPLGPRHRARPGTIRDSAEIPDPASRRLAVISLHAQGWSVTSIAAYLGVARKTVYQILKRWIEEGVRGLEDKSHANTNRPPLVDLRTRNTIRKLQANPLLGEYRMHGALLQLGIRLSPRTCGRIMAENRQLYGLTKQGTEKKEPKPHPFAARFRHEIYIMHLFGEPLAELGTSAPRCLNLLRGGMMCQYSFFTASLPMATHHAASESSWSHCPHTCNGQGSWKVL